VAVVRLRFRQAAGRRIGWTGDGSVPRISSSVVFFPGTVPLADQLGVASPLGRWLCLGLLWTAMTWTHVDVCGFDPDGSHGSDTYGLP